MSDLQKEDAYGALFTYRLTNELRFKESTEIGPTYRLQQKLVCIENGDVEWRDVPRVA